MRREGCKDVCFRTMSLQVVVPRRFAWVCHSISMEWGASENHVAVIALHNCGKSYSQIFELLRPLKTSRLFIYQAIKHHEELWRVEDRAQSGCLKFWGLKPLSKLCGTGFTEIHLCPKSWTYRPIQCHASSGTINTWECTSAQRDASLLLWRRSDGQEQSVSSSGTLRTGTKTSLHGQENLHRQGAVQTLKQQDLCSNILWGEGKCSKDAGRPLPFLYHGLMGGVPSGGDTSSFLQERGETGVRVCQEDVLQGVVKHLNMTLFIGQEWVFQQDSVPVQKAKTIQEWLWRNLLAFISAKNWLSGSADLKPLDNKLWAVLEDMGYWKHHNSLESLSRSLVKAAAEIPLETEPVATAEWPERLKACVKA